MNDQYCDKPDTTSNSVVCCDPQLHAGCTIADGDCEFGFKGFFPKGQCADTQGYNVGTINQALWQLMYGQRCDPVPPFECSPISLPDGVEDKDAAIRSFIYSLRLNPKSYRELAEAMLAYYACTYGESTFQDVRQLFCDHSMPGCEVSMPKCETCGSGVLEGDEVCDGLEFDTTCAMLGLPPGKLSCNEDCSAFDTTGCTLCGNGSLDPGEECDGDDVPSCEELGPGAGTPTCSADCALDVEGCAGGDTGGTETGADTGGQTDDGGGGACECSAGDNGRTGAVWAALVLLACYRRRDL